MAQPQPIRVIVEHRRRSGCATMLGVLLLVGLAVEYWHLALGILVLVVAVGVIVTTQQRRSQLAQQRHRPGPRDPWLNEIAVALGELGLTEVARNTGSQLGGAPLEGDIALQEDRLLVYVNLFANQELARQAQVGLRAQANIRAALADGRAALTTIGPVLLVANGRGGVVDEYRLGEIEHAVQAVPLPPALRSAALPPPTIPLPSPQIGDAEASAGGDPLEQIRKLAELRDAGVLTEAQFEAKKVELLRRL